MLKVTLNANTLNQTVKYSRSERNISGRKVTGTVIYFYLPSTGPSVNAKPYSSSSREMVVLDL